MKTPSFENWFPGVFIILLIASCQKIQINASAGTGPPVPWPDSSSTHPKNTAYTNLIEKYNKLGLPGISLLVYDQYGTWVGAGGKADIRTDIPFVPGTVSKAASITKLFMGALVFKMMEDSINTGIGYNDLHKKITSWLSTSVTDRLPNGHSITLGQCLNHETGIPDIIEQDKFYLAVLNNPIKKWKAEELLEFIYDLPPDFLPSDSAVYSNTNTILVSMILEAISGEKHAGLLKKYILQPLGMKHTYYQPHDELPDFTAQGYFDLYNNSQLVNVSNLVTGSGNGYGGLYSNLFDLFNFGSSLFLKADFLTPSSLSVMQTYGKRDGTNYYGYGLQKSFLDRGTDFGIGHKGRDLGYTANLFYFPSRNLMHIFFINYGTDSDSDLKKTFDEFQNELMDFTLQ